MASVDVSILDKSGWISTGVSDKRLMIDVKENGMGTVLADRCFLHRDIMADYVRQNSDDSITIRCRIRVFDKDDETMIAAARAPVPQPPGVHQVADSIRKVRRDRDTSDSSPSKRRRH